MRSRSQLLVLLAAVCFGTTGTAQALGPAGAPPLVVGAARMAIGAALLLGILVVTRGGWPGRADVPPLAVAAIGVAIYQLCFFTAVRDTGVAVGTVVALGSAPAIAGGLTWILYREVPNRAWVVATALAVAGVAVLVAAGTDARVNPLGVLLALGAGACYAVFTIGSKRMLDAGRPPEAVMAWTFTIGAVLLLPILVLGSIAWLAEPGGMAMVLWLGAVPTALAYVLFGAGLRHLPAREVATLTLLEPVTATVLGLLVIGERPGPAAFAGIALVFLGLAVMTRGAARSQDAATDPKVIAGAG